MMEPFLKNTARYLYDKYGNRLSDCAVVFPNRRASLFFTRYLSQLLKRPVWLPRMFTIGDLMGEISVLEQGDPIGLNFDLYRVFRSVTGQQNTFDEFYSWGEVVLGDFDEIDKYMADAGALFRNLAGLKEMDSMDFLNSSQVEAIRGFWGSFRQGSYSDQQKEFLFIWEALDDIYDAFTLRLREQNLGYEGMIYRDAADRIRKGTASLPGCDLFFMAGFNALNGCEKVLFDHLRKENRAEFFWDYDEWYTSSDSHQAGLFMRENLERFPHTGFMPGSAMPEKREPVIEVIAVPSNSGQCKILPGISEMFSGNPLETAVILPDESLLLPVLSSLPDAAGEINVTMGYPLKEAPAYAFLMHLLSLHENSSSDPDGNTVYQYVDVLDVLQHPCYGGDGAAGRQLVREITSGNMVHVRESLLHGTERGRSIFRRQLPGIPFLDYLRNVMMMTGPADAEETGTSFPEREFVFRICNGLTRLREILLASATEIGSGTLIKLIGKALGGIRVPFHGEPLGGCQVMGVLETRALDFRNVIWLSMNEGVFPARQSGSSFIPHSLRAGWGLPVSDHRDAVYSYYFYRLMQRAERLTLIYNTRSDGLFTGEMSRFIYQLKFSDRFRIRERSIVYNLQSHISPPLHIEKAGSVMDRLSEYRDGNSGWLSPAAINTFIDCSLRFYFRYIVRLPEPDTVKEEIDMAVFGNLLHHAARKIYSPFTGRLVKDEDLRRLLAGGKVENHVRTAFGEVTGRDTLREELSGIDLIVSGVIVTYLKQMLECDRKLAPFSIRALESRYEGKVAVTLKGGKTAVNVGGIIDRVDEVKDAVRIVDYKTGADEAEFRSVASLFERGDPGRPKAVFQAFFYSWLHQQDPRSDLPVKPVLYQARKLFGDDPLSICLRQERGRPEPVDDFRVYMKEFEAGLGAVLEELFNEEACFSQAVNREICRFCPYSVICHR